jgi:hypothetical protein
MAPAWMPRAGARSTVSKPSADGKAVERRQGLGLPLARQLVEAHGGTLELASEPGQGTTAIVELPMRVDLPDLAAMEAFGARIAAALRPGDVVALSGALGMGKPRWPARSSARWGMKARCLRPALPLSSLMMGWRCRWCTPISTGWPTLKRWKNWGWTTIARAACCWPNGPKWRAVLRASRAAFRSASTTKAWAKMAGWLLSSRGRTG